MRLRPAAQPAAARRSDRPGLLSSACLSGALLAVLLAALLAVALPALGPRSAAAADDRVPGLLQQLKAGPVEARRNALVALAERGDSAQVPAVADALRDADPVARQLAERALWSIWLRSGNGEVDALMEAGSALLASGQVEQSVPVFTQIVERAPDFAEGYNKRATAYYHLGAYEKSLQDIAETLKRNPFHFGALSGAGLCLVELERFEEALGYFDRALKINPNLARIAELRKLVAQRVRKPLV